MSKTSVKEKSVCKTLMVGVAFHLNRSSQLGTAVDLRSTQGSLRVSSILTSGMSVEGKLRGGHMTLPLDGRRCGKQTNFGHVVQLGQNAGLLNRMSGIRIPSCPYEWFNKLYCSYSLHNYIGFIVHINSEFLTRGVFNETY